MSNRKEQIRSMFGQPGAAPQVESGNADGVSGISAGGEVGQRPPHRTVAGSVKAMGLSLDALNEQVTEARRLRESLARDERVVDVDPALIDPSPYADRLSVGPQDEGFAALKESIRDGGQQVPVLLRPHPDAAKAGRYQSAYGHRRIQAARELGLAVKAIVRPLTDIELAMAQGRENAERRDLSFIERAMFAQTLLKNGFDRTTAQTALSVHKSEMSRLIQVADAIPRYIAGAIGAAPKVGRPRWQALGEALAGEAAQVKAHDEITSERFRNADSDRRFQMLFSRLTRRPARKRDETALKGANGRRIGALSVRGNRSVITLSGEAGEGFGAFLAARLPALHAEFAAAWSSGRQPNRDFEGD
ncbi:MAG TPA: plasmid partitioning protein RepB [Rhizobiaceae bacterium]|nr:plasmid partitioning protein RepB [Rhizobiaceae bacterium]